LIQEITLPFLFIHYFVITFRQIHVEKPICLPQANAAKLPFEDNNFDIILNAAMLTMSPPGMISDEGIMGTLKIIKNALKPTNRPMFLRMFKTMRKHKNNMNYIVHAVRK